MAKPVGSFGCTAAYSFFIQQKNLPAMGDAGAVAYQ